jgi:hypothetical protein
MQNGVQDARVAEEIKPGILQKPVARETLASELRRVLDRPAAK